MKTFYKSKGIIILFGFCAAVLLLGGCGGGGGGGSSFSPGGSADTGAVSVFLADGPSDDYDHFWVWLKSIKIYPADQKGSITIFKAEDPSGHKIDLLDLRDRELLLSVKKNVLSGRYSGVAMEFGRIKPEGPGICSGESLIANKFIEYHHLFEVKKGRTSAMHLDIDIDKSLNSPDGGHSGECEFWPVLSMKVDHDWDERDCPEIVNGIVKKIEPEPDDQLVRLTLDLKEPWYHQNGDGDDQLNPQQYRSGSIDVLAFADTTIIDENGEPIGLRGLGGREGQQALARGYLNQDGDLEASLLVFGGVSVFRGIVTESSTRSYTITMPSGDLTVSLGRQSFILTQCDEQWQLGTPVPLYSLARVYGKFGDDNDFLGIVTLLRPQTVRGDLTEITAARGGYNLMVETRNGDVEVFLPAADSDQVYLKPDYPIGLQSLQESVACKSRRVEILTVPAETWRLTATRVTLPPEVTYGIVRYTDVTERYMVTEDGKKIYVAEDAKIFRLSYGEDDNDEDDHDHQQATDFSGIDPGDKIRAYGLAICPENDSDFEFDAYYLIVRSLSPEPDPETVVIRRNKVAIYLPAGEYNKKLRIEGNKVRVIGQRGGDCENSDGWTVLKGSVFVNGNKAEFHNIWFENQVVIEKNNAEFENVVFEDDIVDSGNNTSINTCNG